MNEDDNMKKPKEVKEEILKDENIQVKEEKEESVVSFKINSYNPLIKVLNGIR